MNLRELRERLGGRGDDGLTAKERKAIAEEYIRKVAGALTEQEKEALAAWRERRLG